MTGTAAAAAATGATTGVGTAIAVGCCGVTGVGNAVAVSKCPEGGSSFNGVKNDGWVGRSEPPEVSPALGAIGIRGRIT